MPTSKPQHHPRTLGNKSSDNPNSTILTPIPTTTTKTIPATKKTTKNTNHNAKTREKQSKNISHHHGIAAKGSAKSSGYGSGPVFYRERESKRVIKKQKETPEQIKERRDAMLEEYQLWKQHVPSLYDRIILTKIESRGSISSMQWLRDRQSGVNGIGEIPNELLLTLTDPGGSDIMLYALNESSDDITYEVTLQKHLSTPGCIQKVSYMPQRPSMIGGQCSRNDYGIRIYDLNKVKPWSRSRSRIKRTRTRDNDHKALVLTLGPLENQGSSLSWNFRREGELVSACNDGQIHLWNVESNFEKKTSSTNTNTDHDTVHGSTAHHANTNATANAHSSPNNGYNANSSSRNGGFEIAPVHTFRINNPNPECEFDTVLGHTSTSPVVQVEWSTFNDTAFLSVSENGLVCTWDKRTHKPCTVHRPYQRATSGRYSPLNEFLFASGGYDDQGQHVINIEDSRKRSCPIRKLVWHTAQITDLSWSPSNQHILSSGALDRRVAVWDISKQGKAIRSHIDSGSGSGRDQGEHFQHVPDALMFVHGGHQSGLVGLDFRHGFQMATTDACRIIIWEPSEFITNPNAKREIKKTLNKSQKKRSSNSQKKRVNTSRSHKPSTSAQKRPPLKKQRMD